MGKISLLDCTLRDGGYVNDWHFGHSNMVNIFERLISAGVDIAEVGFLDARASEDEDFTIQPDTAAMNRIWASFDKKDTMVVGMIDYGTCPIENVMPAKDCWLDGIRVIFKLEKMKEAIAFCGQIKALGYKVFAQAVSITSYDDDTLMELLELVNALEPYAFSLVDTYGLLHKENLKHYFELADEKLLPGIGLGYHAHNNFQLAYANCIEVLESGIERPLIVDGSLYGMGKSAGNAPSELLAMYMNQHMDKHYHISQLLEAIDTTVMEIYERIPWGYKLKFYLSASNDCHPNYVTYLMDKQKLSVKSINEILGLIKPDKKLHYDQEYVEELYQKYQAIDFDDEDSKRRLAEILKGRKVLLLAPGNHVIDQQERIQAYIDREKPVVMSINFVPADYPLDFVFVSNAKRYVRLATKLSREYKKLPTIATTNVTKTSGEFDYTFTYSSLLDEEALIVDNPMIMILRLFNQMEIREVAFAGFDGYKKAATPNYVNQNMEHTFTKEKAEEINEDVRQSLKRLTCPYEIKFITDTCYTL